MRLLHQSSFINLFELILFGYGLGGECVGSLSYFGDIGGFIFAIV